MRALGLWFTAQPQHLLKSSLRPKMTTGIENQELAGIIAGRRVGKEF